MVDNSDKIPLAQYKGLSKTPYILKIGKIRTHQTIEIPLVNELVFSYKEKKIVDLPYEILIPTGYRGIIINNALSELHKLQLSPQILLPGEQKLQLIINNENTDGKIIQAGNIIGSIILIPNSIQNIPVNKNMLKYSQPFKLIQVPNNDFLKEKVQLNLLEMAELSDISATSYMIQVDSQPISKNLQFYTFENRFNLDKKLYIRTFIAGNKVIACLDNGSDLTLMQESLFKDLFDSKITLESTIISNIKTFSNNTIKVLGQFTCHVKFDPTSNSVPLTIMVIRDINSSIPSFLFGNDSFKKCMATLSYTGNILDPTPEFVVNNPEQIIVPVYQASPYEIYSCSGDYYLKPFETKDIEVFLHPAAPVLRHHEILISSTDINTVHFLPSKTDVTFSMKDNCYVAMACICNLTQNIQEGVIKGRFEILNMKNYNTHLIHEQGKQILLTKMQKNPPAREILSSKIDSNIGSLPLISLTSHGYKETKSSNTKNIRTINKAQTIDSMEVLPSESPKYDSNDTNNLPDKEAPPEYDSTEILGYKNVTYSGEAEISSKIIDGGLEIPTLIHKSPEEALNLEIFSPEIRPYLKSIFLEKYPSVVSLHSLDAGDVSKTLGYTTLRLIPGEHLPRHKRIYQLSPQDANYLEQLLEQFIKFNYVRRAPIESTDIHLYGMSTYLVPRKKLTDIARLVIDFSPLTSIIQSPPSIVPDISASLQQLQGKALYSAMDLRYAYLALKIDEPSMSLTTFLTPKGAYQWKSIPTGAACSPAYFIDAVNRILHYKPVLDKNGEPIFESKK